MQHHHRFRNVSLILWLMAITTLPSLTHAENILERIFEEGSHLRGEDYVRARNTLVNRGGIFLPFIENKAWSKDLNERLFAKILISRIKQPQTVEMWHKNLMSLVKEYRVLKATRTYRKIEWDKLPKNAADVPPFHLIDVLWQYSNSGSAREREITAVALQFYLAPDMEALDAVIEVVLSDHELISIAKTAIVKLGDVALPRIRNVLTKTIKMQPSEPWESNLTRKQRQDWEKYNLQTSRALVATYIVSRLDDRESIPLIARCLTGHITNHKYIEELLEHLAYMKAIEAVDSMLDCTLKSAVNRWYYGNSNRPGYIVLRRHIQKLGRLVLPALRNRLSATVKEGEKVVLTNLIAELSGVKGKEKKVAELRESLWFKTTTANLLKLRELTGEDIFARLKQLMLARRIRSWHNIATKIDERTSACLALGTLKEVRAVPILAEEIRKQHAYLEKKLSERNTKENAEPFDPQKQREAGYTFGRRENDLAQALAWGDTCLLALRRIGGNKAKAVVAMASGYHEYATRARISILIMENKIGKIAEHLHSEDRTLREEAALALLERQDKRATHELLCAATRRQGPSHEQWKKYALSSRKNIMSVLRELTKSNNVREQVLGDVMIIELESPEEAKKCKRLLQQTALNASMMHVQTIGMVESAGRGLVKQINESFVPLVEATCMFGQGVISRGVAAYALAEFKKPRSMHVLAESFNMGSLGGSNPAALALVDYGEKGAELAANVPAPIHGEHETGLRMTSHRASARVLAENKDIRGVDEILKGLETLKKDRTLDMWSHRMGIYLGAAGKLHDKRLVKPLLQILAIAEKPESNHHAQVINILSAYDDKRLVPLFTQHLGTLNPKKGNPTQNKIYGAALTALTRRLGEKTPKYLIKQFKQSRNNRIRGAALLALGELSYPKFPPYPGKERWSVERFKRKEDRDKNAANVRKLAYPVLVKALKNPAADVNRMAALGLTIFTTGNKYSSIDPDLRAVDPLNEWCRAQDRSFFVLTQYLGAHGNAESGKALLTVLQSQPPTKSDHKIVLALEKLKPRGAVPVFVRNIRAKAPKCKWWNIYKGHELEALAEFGKEGANALLEIFNSTDNLAYKIQSAYLLGKVGNKEAVDGIAVSLTKLIAAGPENPKLILKYNEHQEEAYKRSCQTMLEALANLDAVKAHKHAKQIFLNGPQELKTIALKTLTRIE